MNQNLITPKELYNRLQSKGISIGLNTIYKLVKTKSFPSLKIGHKYFVIEDKVDEYFERQANNYYER